MKIIFMGTPEFAVRILEEVHKKHEVILVVTQPDSYNNRKKSYISTPVKKWALEHNLKVVQPEKIKDFTNDILALDVDLIVTAAYGQFVPKKILDHPKYRSINVHGSILPKYRGGAPIQRAIINGETETGVTIMYMDKKMDAGDILRIKKIPILDEDTQDTMFEKLSILGQSMILEVIDDLEKGNINPIKQNEEEATFAYNLTKEDEKVDFNKSARSLFNQIRGLNSNPGAYFILDNLNVKVYASRVSDYKTNKSPGTIVAINKDSFDVACGDGSVLSILELQIPSKNKMSVKDFLNGVGKKMIMKDKVIL